LERYRQLRNQPQSGLIVTLGSEAQVVTAVFDLLLQQGENIREVTILHTDDGHSGVISKALARLKPALAALPETTVQFQPICDSMGRVLPDVESESSAQAAFRQIYRSVFQAKQRGLKVHLSIAGGRKTLAVFGMAAAQLLFDGEDRLWHLFSAGEFLSSKRLHPTPCDEVRLIPVPVLVWSAVSPILAGLQKIEDPYLALEHIRGLQLTEKNNKCELFWLTVLSEGERRVVELLVLDGLSDIEIGEQLYLSPRTVEQHLRKSYQKAADFWTLTHTPNRAQLISILSFYLSTRLNRGNPA